jgi:hypothetical protein
VLAAVEGGQAAAKFLVELTQLGGTGLFVFFQKAEGFPDNFAGGVVAARLNLVVYELLQFTGERNVH